MLEQGAGQRRLQFFKAEHQTRAPVHQQGRAAAGHQAGEQAKGDNTLLARGDGLLEQGGGGDQFPGIGFARLLERQHLAFGLQLGEGGFIAAGGAQQFAVFDQHTLGALCCLQTGLRRSALGIEISVGLAFEHLDQQPTFLQQAADGVVIVGVLGAQQGQLGVDAVEGLRQTLGGQLRDVAPQVHQGFRAVVKGIELGELLVDVADLVRGLHADRFDVDRILDFVVADATAPEGGEVLLDRVLLGGAKAGHAFGLVDADLLVEVLDGLGNAPFAILA